ncbi:hypothetical protein IPL85_04465 [Candidatus Saccharibacteria bacterium]|nr:MAG: hypothetical protein IPL85_04465 [Candidatus Saccharibacteria bacterium]
MMESGKDRAPGADTVLRCGLVGDAAFMEQTLRSLPPPVLQALQKTARSLYQQPNSGYLSPEAAFMTGAAVAIAVIRAEAAVAQVEAIFVEH